MILFGRQLSATDLPILFFVPGLLLVTLARDLVPFLDDHNALRPAVMAFQLIFIFLCLITYQGAIKVSKAATWLLGAFFLSATVSTIMSDHPWQGAVRLAEILTLCVFSLALTSYYRLNGHRRNYERFAISCLIFLSAIVITIYVVTGLVIPDAKNINWVHEPPVFSNIRFASHLFIIVIPLIYGRIITDNNNRLPIFYFFLITAIWAFSIWSGGRAAILLLTGVTIWIMIRHIRPMIWVIPAIAAGYFIGSELPSVSHSQDFIRPVEDGSPLEKLNALSSGRVYLWLGSLELWWNHNFWFGIGADGFQYLIPAIGTQSVSHPHSLLFQILTSYGFLGFALLTMLSTITLIKYWAASEVKMSHFYFMSIISVIFLSMVDGNLYHSLSLIFFSIILSAWLANSAHAIGHYYTSRSGGWVLITPLISITLTALVQIWGLNQQWKLPTRFFIDYPLYVHGNLVTSDASSNATDAEIINFLKAEHPNPCRLPYFGISLTEQEEARFCLPSEPPM